MVQDNKKVNANADEVSLRDLLFKLNEWVRFLRSKWLIILSAAILGGVIGVTYALLKKPLYQSELSFALEDDKAGGGLGAAAGLASQLGFDLGGGGGGSVFAGDNLLELMKSRSMVEKTLLSPIVINGKSETLADLYISFKKIHKKWEDEPKLKNINFAVGANRSNFTLQQDSVLNVFYKELIKENVSVDKTDKKLSIIYVKVISENENFSKYFSEMLVKTVSDFYINTKTKKSVQNVNILQRQTDSVRYELNKAIGGVASSVDVNPNPNPMLQILRVPSQRRQVDVQANTAILSQLVANLELSKVSLRKETPLIQVIDKPIFPLEKIKLGRLKAFIITGMVSAFLTILVLIISRFLKNIIESEK
jgi:hypothetical protein